MTLSELLKAGTVIVGDSSESPVLDSRLVITHILNIGDSAFILHPDLEVPQSDCDRILNLLEQHHDGLPVAYITGRRAFWRDEFKTSPGVLIPQPDTETLVQGALDCIPSRGRCLRILDLCSGTGCVGISIAKELSSSYDQINLTLSDIDPKAFDCLSYNAKALITDCGITNINVSTVLGDLYNTVKGRCFDLIVSNPPYIQSEVANSLGPEVKAQGMLALDGGADGLDLVRRIIDGSRDHQDGPLWMLMEIGYDQGEATRGLFESAGFENIAVLKDLGGRDRVVKGLRK